MTLGDPDRVTGGYLYHRRMAEMAPSHDADLRFVSVGDGSFATTMLRARRLHREVAGSDCVILDSIVAAFAAPWLDSVTAPIVAAIHQQPGGIDHGRMRRIVQRTLDRRAYVRCGLLIAASDSLAADLRRERLGPSVVVVPPGRDVAGPPKARSGATRLRGERRMAVLCVGNWVARKGILPLLEAVASLPEDSVMLHLVGDTGTDAAYAARVWERLRSSDLRDRVVVHGAVAREVVAELYAGVDVFALPSEREPYGTVYGEAMATGLPVVAWRAGNILHLARDRTEALLSDVGDVQGLAACLLRLARDQPLRQAMGVAAAARASSFPTWRESGEMFFEAIRGVVPGGA